MTQAAFAEVFGVKQASVSRWESGRDSPSPKQRQKLMELWRVADAPRLRQQLKARLVYAPNPISIVGRGAQFLEFSHSFGKEAGVATGQLKGGRIYGHFGDIVDRTTEVWERSGIFKGDIAFTLTVLTLTDVAGQIIYLKNFDTPYQFEDEIVSVCEVKRIDGSEGSVAKIVKLEHAWRRLDGRNDDGFQ
ncbi:helix-turn-helix transcriptional regulator, partial [Sphingobium yanoikuyae]|uniref:helix-turn-helix domain-containing protein n=1 Tax=Sphingobium yanoikuyae TaxID=13690 RepID=UPI00240F581F